MLYRWTRVIIAAIVIAIAAYVIAVRAGAFRLTTAELRERYAAPDAKVVEIRGVPIYFQDQGSGPPVVLLHGSFGNTRTWDGVVAKLSSKYRLIRFDRPPYALSGSISDDIAKSDLAPEDIVAGLLDHLNIEKTSLAGVSSGGTLAYYFAAKYPQRVDRMVLSNAPADPVGVTGQSMARKFMIWWNDDVLKFRTRFYWVATMDELFGDPKRASQALIDEYYDINRKVPERNLERLSVFTRAADQKRVHAMLGEIEVPTLLVWGSLDTALPPAKVEIFEGYMKKAPVSKIFMPDVGHYPPLEVPERFAEILDKFLSAKAD